MPTIHKLLPTFILVLLTILSTGNVSGQITWDDVIQVAPSSFGNNRPRMVINRAGHPLVLWGKSTDAWFSKWDGSNFSEPRKLNPEGMMIASATWMGPEIAAHGDTVYVVFKQTPEDLVTSYIWCVKSIDGGETFLDPVRVEDTGIDKSRFPTVTTDDEGHPIIAYMRFNQHFHEARWVVTRSFDFGATFTSDVLASGWSGPDAEACDCCPATITCSGEQVALVYRDNNNDFRDSWAGVSTDGGITFTRGVNIDQNGWMITACPATGPDGIIVGDTLYATFMNGQSGQAIVYHNVTPLNTLETDLSTQVPGSGNGLQENFPRIDAYDRATALLWRHSANFSTGLALMFTEDISKGFPSSFDTLAYAQVGNGDVAVSATQVFTAWQDNSSSSVKFRAGSYEGTTGVDKPIYTHSLNVYPNPVANELHLGIDAASIRIMDMAGRIILNGKGKQIDVQSLPSGFYFISTEAGWGKFVKL